MNARGGYRAPLVAIPPGPPDVPVYRRLYETLRRSILTGQLAPGSKMPSTRELSLQLSVSRMTVVNAYDQLAAEGYISGRSGSGTYVAQILPEELLQIEGPHPAAAPPVANEPPRISRRGRMLASFDSSLLRPSRTGNTFSAFHPGVPAMDAFPFDIWSKLYASRLKRMSGSLFGSGDPAGYAPLRDAVAAYLRNSRGVRCSPEQVFVVAGSQQALALIAQVLVDRGDTVWMEDPGHLATRNLFAIAGANILPVPIDSEGFDLPWALRHEGAPRLAFVTPSHQFPLGTVMSLPRRLALLKWARDSGAWIVEDDYDSEFRYAGRPLPSLQGLSERSAERVIHVGTFSLTVFPSLRLGHMVVPEDLIGAFAAARALSDAHSPSIDQAVLTDFIELGHFSRHIRKMRSLYAERQAALLSAASDRLGGLLDVSPDDAGTYLIGWLPRGSSDKWACAQAEEYGVTIKPLSVYSAAGLDREGVILGYTAFTPGQIRHGVDNLAKALV